MAECSEWSFSDTFPTSDTGMLPSAGNIEIDQLDFLMQGYLHITEEKIESDPLKIYLSPSNGNAGKAAHMSLVRRTSDSSIRGNWRKRWCVLSRTPDGVHLVNYKHQGSFANCEPPVGVVFMERCHALYTIPSHSKSQNTFSLSFPNINILLYPDKETDLEKWLSAFEGALDLRDGTVHSPLKGLPKTKADRKETPPTHSHITPLPSNPEPTKWARNAPAPPDVCESSKVTLDVDEDSKVKVVSYRMLTEDEIRARTLPRTPPSHITPPTPQSKPRPHSVLKLDDDENSIQFLGYKPLQ